MTRISKTYQGKQDSGHKALVVYLVGGDREPDWTVPLMHSMVSAGADIIELGVPFTDPEAEGPVIQEGHERALAHGTSLTDMLAMVAEFRLTNHDTPVVMMGYVNPIEVMGYETFAERAETAGVDGTIIVNLPPEEGEEMEQLLTARGLSPVYLLAPTTTEKRAQMICSRSNGFVYYVSLKGVTGAGHLNIKEVAGKVATFKSYTDLPVAVGFGIKDATSAAAIAEVADGVVVGSALVKLIAEADDLAAACSSTAELVSSMRQAMDSIPN